MLICRYQRTHHVLTIFVEPRTVLFHHQPTLPIAIYGDKLQQSLQRPQCLGLIIASTVSGLTLGNQFCFLYEAKDSMNKSKWSGYPSLETTQRLVYHRIDVFADWSTTPHKYYWLRKPSSRDGRRRSTPLSAAPGWNLLLPTATSTEPLPATYSSKWLSSQ